MEKRYFVTCMPETDVAKRIYEKVLKPLMPQDSERLNLISYLDSPIIGEFDPEIRNWIHLSNGIIAIVDEKAPNVFYEIGVAVGFGKPVIILAHSTKVVPEMLRSRNVIVYDPKNLDSPVFSNKLVSALKAILNGSFIDNRFQNHTNLLIGQSAPITASIPTFEETCPIIGDELEIGIQKYKQKKFDEAIKCFERGLSMGNQEADMYYFMSDSYFLLGESLQRGQRQLKAYQNMQHYAYEGHRLFEKNIQLQKNLGLSYMKLGEFNLAEKFFMDITIVDPDYIEAPYNLACLYALQHKISKCLNTLSDVFERNPEWRYLARFDSDFDVVWKEELIQRLMFPCPIKS